MEPQDADQAVFVLHIPKTAGTSLRSLFEHNYSPVELVRLYPPVDAAAVNAARERMRSGGRVVYGHLDYGIREVLGVPGRYVTLLRDPVERVVSYYRHNLGHAHAEHHEVVKGGLSLHDFVAQRVTFETRNHMTRIIAGPSDGEAPDDDAVLERALRNLREDFAFVGTAERLDEAVVELGAILDWTGPPVRPPRLNEAQAPEQVLDDATREVIEDENRLDIELYRAVGEMIR